MGGSIFLASAAFDDSDSQAVKSIAAGSVADRVMAEMQYARRFSERTAHAVTFSVPDLDGDGSEDTLRFAWSGTPGDPLTESFNGGPASVLIEDVQDLNFNFMTRDVTAPPPPPVVGGGDLLLVVGDPGNLTSGDTGRKSLLESWGYTVELIDDGDLQANFDAAAAAADVVYVAPSISGGSLAHKLTGSPSPIVNEFPGKLDNFGFCSSTSQTQFGDTVTILDDSHYIASVFPTSLVTVSSASFSMSVADGTPAPGLEEVAGISERPTVMALETGAQRYDGGTAPARRVHLPYAYVDPSYLTEDGQTLMRRAVEWAAGANEEPGGSALLFVSGGSVMVQFPSGEPLVVPTAQEQDRIDLMESWGYAVNLIHESATQEELDAAAAANEVVYVSQEIATQTVGAKLKALTIGIVNEEYLLSDELGFSTGGGSGFYNDMNVLDDTHYITSVFSSGALSLFDAYDIYTGGGMTLAPGLQVLGECGIISALIVLETGATLHDGGAAAGRRVQVPWGDDFAALNTDGQMLMKRAIEWAAGAGEGGSGGGDPPTGPTVSVAEQTDARAGSNTTSLTITKPPGTVEGDLLVAAVATDGNSASSIAAPPGWNLISVGEQSRSVTFGVWWKLAGATEPASYQFTWGGVAEEAFGWIMRFTGHDPTSPIATTAVGFGKSASATCANVITSFDNALILRLGGFDDDDITVGNPGLPGHTPIVMDKSNTGNFSVSGGAGYLVQPTAGDSGTSDFALTNSEEYRTVTIAIRPEGGG
jgi:hypothetical protein